MTDQFKSILKPYIHLIMGPISLAAGIQLSASIPNVLCQEQVSLGEGYLIKS